MIHWYANIRNGLPFPHEGVCYFQSMYGHHYKDGYFRLDSMPLDAVIHLLSGEQIGIVDGTQHNKPLSDALRFGVPTWCMVFNRSLRNPVPVCEWETPEMRRAAGDNRQKPLVKTIRKLVAIYGATQPAVIGRSVILRCARTITWDDKPDEIRRLIHANLPPIS